MSTLAASAATIATFKTTAPVQKDKLGGRKNKNKAPGTNTVRWKNDDDLAVRLQIQNRVELLLLEQKPDASLQWRLKLPLLAEKLDASLYRSAPSFEAYRDVNTLRHRLETLAQTIIEKIQNDEERGPQETSRKRHQNQSGGPHQKRQKYEEITTVAAYQLSPRYFEIQCLRMIEGLLFHPNGWVFAEPIDPDELGLADYHEVIKQPMDLGTIKNRLEKGEYQDAKQVEADCLLTFHNAMKYNPDGSELYEIAKDLKEEFQREYAKLSTHMYATRAA